MYLLATIAASIALSLSWRDSNGPHTNQPTNIMWVRRMWNEYGRHTKCECEKCAQFKPLSSPCAPPPIHRLAFDRQNHDYLVNSRVIKWKLSNKYFLHQDWKRIVLIVWWLMTMGGLIAFRRTKYDIVWCGEKKLWKYQFDHFPISHLNQPVTVAAYDMIFQDENNELFHFDLLLLLCALINIVLTANGENICSKHGVEPHPKSNCIIHCNIWHQYYQCRRLGFFLCVDRWVERWCVDTKCHRLAKCLQ